MVKWYRELVQILEEEPETWLAYLYGVQLDNIPHFGRAKPRFRGIFFRSLVVLHFLAKNFRLRRMPRISCQIQPSFLVYAGTINQMNALDSTIDSLRESGESVMALAKRELINTGGHKVRYRSYGFGPADAAQAIVLMVSRGWKLYRDLKKRHVLAVDWYFNRFCQVYVYLAYFRGLLKKIHPKFVVIANDHNVPNRCILAVAHRLGIKTVYMQHASVSSLFPALRVNYAFLDGQAALDIYRQCEGNQPLSRRRAPTPYVFLTGQKKHLIRSDGRGKHYLGIALNALDDPEAVIEFVQKIIDAGELVCCRWHPGQPPRQVERYREAWGINSQIKLSDPRTEPISVFLGRIRLLVAGNSSVHLEAVLAGVPSVYHEFATADNPDLYGYVRHGLILQIHSVDELLEILRKDEKLRHSREDAVRYYSATYHTEWDGREGELVAHCLRELAAGADAEQLFGSVASHGGPLER